MSSIVVSGDTSGAITISAPAVAGTNTLSLPASTGTILTTTGGVTPGTLGNVLTSNGTTWVSQAPGGGFASGTVMLFAQTSAPTGWTKQTNLDNYALRVVSGSAGTGGSVAFTTAFASGLSDNAVTLSTSQIPSHSHSVGAINGGCFQTGGVQYNPLASSNGTTTAIGTSSTGGGGSHTHTLPSFAVQYVDVIRATAN